MLPVYAVYAMASPFDDQSVGKTGWSKLRSSTGSPPVTGDVIKSILGAVPRIREKATAVSVGDQTGNQSMCSRDSGCAAPRERSRIQVPGRPDCSSLRLTA